MGRKKKYNTTAEQKAARSQWNKAYYEKNKDRLNKKSMEKYYELQKNSRPDNRESNEGG